MKENDKIREAIRNIAGGKSAIIQGVVTAVDQTNRTATIKLDDEGVITQDVRLTSVQGSGDFVVFPKNGTTLLAARILNADKWVMVTCDEVDEVWLRGESYTTLKGEETKTELNKLAARVTNIENAIKNSVVASGDGGATYKLNMTTILEAFLNSEDFSDIENNKVKHG